MTLLFTLDRYPYLHVQNVGDVDEFDILSTNEALFRVNEYKGNFVSCANEQQVKCKCCFMSHSLLTLNKLDSTLFPVTVTSR